MYLVAHFSILQACIDQLNRLLIILYWNDDKILHKGLALLDWLSNGKFAIGRIEEIIDVLHVYLHERNTDAVLILLFALR